MRLFLDELFAADRTAKLARPDAYLAAASRKVRAGDVVTLTGPAPVWLYLAVAHALHGKACRLYYQSPVTGKVPIFNHDAG